jgi:hypothetical protein
VLQESRYHVRAREQAWQDDKIKLMRRCDDRTVEKTWSPTFRVPLANTLGRRHQPVPVVAVAADA